MNTCADLVSMKKHRCMDLLSMKDLRAQFTKYEKLSCPDSLRMNKLGTWVC